MYRGLIQDCHLAQQQTCRKLSAVGTRSKGNAISILSRKLRKWRQANIKACIAEWLHKIAGDRLYEEFERTNALHREQAEEKAAMLKGMRDKEKALRRREKALEAAYAELGVEEAPTAGRKPE